MNSFTNSKTESPTGYQFGTFGGVFTPSILTIFGLIMYMRAGHVVGQAGWINAILILGIAQTIVWATGLSICAISTNTPVKGGGAYFLISRTLGPGFGVVVGMTLYVAQMLSVPFYIFGFVEAIFNDFAINPNYYGEVSFITGLVIFFITFFGASFAIRIQYIILAILGISILSFSIGMGLSFNTETFWHNADLNATAVPPVSLFLLFGMYFPAVTGIMSGINMSGDLKNPSKSLPKGTLAALLVSGVIYFLQMLLFAGVATRQDLVDNSYGVLLKNALWGSSYLISAGVIVATLSSALGAMMGAPRILQALAQDKILRPLSPLGKGTGPYNEPRRALWFSLLLIMLVLYWGGKQGLNAAMSPALNAVASMVTMFFLYTYCIICLAAFIESYGKNPSFRPRFHFFHWGIALFGFISCFICSIIVDWAISLGTLVFISILFFWVSRKSLEVTFGDARRGFILSQIRSALIRLNQMPMHPKNWRPIIAVLSGNPSQRSNLVGFAARFEGGRGILSLVNIIVGKFDKIAETRYEAQKELVEFAKEQNISCFPEPIVAEDLDTGLNLFLQCHSIGAIKPNLIMLGCPNNLERVPPYIRLLKMISDFQMSIVIAIVPENFEFPKTRRMPGRIDIWWNTHSRGSLSLILAYLLTCNHELTNISLRIIQVINNENDKTDTQKQFEEIVAAARIDAEIDIIVSPSHDLNQLIRQKSSDAFAVFLGLHVPQDETTEAINFHKNLIERSQNMPPTFFVFPNNHADFSA